MDTQALRRRLFDGLVIPAHPLALAADRKLDERRQRGLTRYYLAAGAGGIAIGVHTTQFAIRDPAYGAARAPPRPDHAGDPRPRAALGRPDREDRRRDRADPAGGARGGAGGAPRVRRRAARARLGEGSIAGRRGPPPLPGGGPGAAPVRILPPAGSGRDPPSRGFLGPVPGDRERGRHQGGAVQPVPYDRRGAPARRERPAGRGGALHGQRRFHRRRPRHPVRLRGRRSSRGGEIPRRPARALGLLDAGGRDAARPDQGRGPPRRTRAVRAPAPGGRGDRHERRGLRRGQRLPGLHRRACTRCSSGRGCSRDGGASTPPRTCPRASSPRSTAWPARTPTWSTTRSSPQTGTGGWREPWRASRFRPASPGAWPRRPTRSKAPLSPTGPARPCGTSSAGARGRSATARRARRPATTTGAGATTSPSCATWAYAPTGSRRRGTGSIPRPGGRTPRASRSTTGSWTACSPPASNPG